MPKVQQVKCPSCQEEVTLGKYCLSCGAELVSERAAKIGGDALDQIADRAAAKVIDALDKRERAAVEQKERDRLELERLDQEKQERERPEAQPKGGKFFGK